MATLAEHEQAMLRSQSDLLLEHPSQLPRPPGSPGWIPTSSECSSPGGSVSLSLSLHACCRCGRSLDVFGHHRAACSRAGVLGRRGFSVESVAARICREGGARVTTNLLVRDMDLRPPNVIDSRRLEVVADGLPLFGGVQLAVDTTLVSPLHCDGTARRHTAHVDGAVLVMITTLTSPRQSTVFIHASLQSRSLRKQRCVPRSPGLACPQATGLPAVYLGIDLSSSPTEDEQAQVYLCLGRYGFYRRSPATPDVSLFNSWTWFMRGPQGVTTTSI